MIKTFSITLLLASSLASVALAQDIGCFLPGQCQGTVLANNPADNVVECVDWCDQVEHCHYFTYYTDTHICSSFDDCDSLDMSCTTCVSGDEHCALECFEEGFCQGVEVGVIIAADIYECINYCVADPRCQYYTFDTSDGFCTTTENCEHVEHDCNTCLHGVRACSYLPQPTTTTMTTTTSTTTTTTTTATTTPPEVTTYAESTTPPRQ